MNTKFLRAAALSTLLLATSAVSVAAAGGGTSNYPGASAQSREHGSMMGGMMGMGGNMGMDAKTAMRMHGEMMKAMGDIMLKYSDQAGTAPSK